MEQTKVIATLDVLIERVEDHICCQLLSMERGKPQDESTLSDMLETLEHLQAYRERFYATLH